MSILNNRVLPLVLVFSCLYSIMGCDGSISEKNLLNEKEYWSTATNNLSNNSEAIDFQRALQIACRIKNKGGENELLDAVDSYINTAHMNKLLSRQDYQEWFDSACQLDIALSGSGTYAVTYSLPSFVEDFGENTLVIYAIVEDEFGALGKFRITDGVDRLAGIVYMPMEGNWADSVQLNLDRGDAILFFIEVFVADNLYLPDGATLLSERLLRIKSPAKVSSNE